MDHAGTGIPTLAPYEILAPKEPHLRVGSEAEANPNRKTKNKKKSKKQTTALPPQEMSHLVGTNSETWTRFHVLNFDEEDSGAPRPNNMTTWTVTL